MLRRDEIPCIPKGKHVFKYFAGSRPKIKTPRGVCKEISWKQFECSLHAFVCPCSEDREGTVTGVPGFVASWNSD